MVLHLDQPQPGLARILRRQIFRMQIGGDRRRSVVEQRRVVRDTGPVVVERACVLQVADVLRQDRRAVLQQAERRLQLAARRQQVGRTGKPGRQDDRSRRKAARAAQDARRIGNPPHHRIVDARGDRPVVRQHGIGDALQPGLRLGVVGDLRFVRQVAAGHHHGMVEVPQQQQMQRRRRQHEPERGQAGSDRVGQRGTGRLQQHDRRLGAGQQPCLAGRHPAVATDHVDIACHQCERLGLAVLRRAQLRHRPGIRGVACKLVAAQPLHRHDPSVAQQCSSVGDRIARPGRQQPRARPARRTGDRLGMEPPIRRIAGTRRDTPGTARTPPWWSRRGRTERHG